MGKRKVGTAAQVGVAIGRAIAGVYSTSRRDGQVRGGRRFVRHENVIGGEMVGGGEGGELGKRGRGVVSHDIGEGVAIVVVTVL